ncbi:Ktr system potassium transporter B [Terrilactibacillus sp. BCM23-1]|uniref:Ktr system potassium transporter B n=1 Tax=Terrilactibacillus tamarindi TaxID=2599694 RepID=A0A6N8CLT1_9BACI|nr:Ktr system potassium transporter B [Terrilactibacillus tamarindi]
MPKIFKLNPFQFLVLLFLSLITAGAILLKLPFSTYHSISWIDSFFIATSAATVTGLVTVDPASSFTLFGKLVIMFLIQLGGLGIMSFAIFFIMLLGKKISIKERQIMKEALNQPSIGGVIRLVRNLIIFSIIIELTGSVILSFRFVPELGWTKGGFYSLFHSISAFNNAGFALWSNGLSDFVGDPIVNLAITFLIITGGIGFTVLSDIWDKRKYKKLTLHSKVMLVGTLVVNLVAIFTIYFLECHNVKTLGALSSTDKIWAAYFQGISPRTAGFNTIDMTKLEPSTALFTILLMFIGAGSTSTGGGIKLTTFFVILFAVVSLLRGNEDVVIGKRRLSHDKITRSLAISFFSIIFIFISLFILTITEKASFLSILFEIVSAFGTVGLSMGITSHLSLIGKFVIIVMMIFGKIGPISLVFFITKSKQKHFHYPDAKIFIG